VNYTMMHGSTNSKCERIAVIQDGALKDHTYTRIKEITDVSFTEYLLFE
jgi:hypothetical protein